MFSAFGLKACCFGSSAIKAHAMCCSNEKGKLQSSVACAKLESALGGRGEFCCGVVWCGEVVKLKFYFYSKSNQFESRSSCCGCCELLAAVAVID